METEGEAFLLAAAALARAVPRRRCPRIRGGKRHAPGRPRRLPGRDARRAKAARRASNCAATSVDPRSRWPPAPPAAARRSGKTQLPALILCPKAPKHAALMAEGAATISEKPSVESKATPARKEIRRARLAEVCNRVRRSRPLERHRQRSRAPDGRRRILRLGRSPTILARDPGVTGSDERPRALRSPQSAPPLSALKRAAADRDGGTTASRRDLGRALAEGGGVVRQHGAGTAGRDAAGCAPRLSGCAALKRTWPGAHAEIQRFYEQLGQCGRGDRRTCCLRRQRARRSGRPGGRGRPVGLLELSPPASNRGRGTCAFVWAPRSGVVPRRECADLTRSPVRPSARPSVATKSLSVTPCLCAQRAP